MDQVVLGRTGLQCSVMGLGGGGHSRLGLAKGLDEDHAVSMVRQALDLGINFFDTAEGYRTESAVGRGIADVPRESVVLSTKVRPGRDTDLSGDDLRSRAMQCLERLGTDYVDILHLHGVQPAQYVQCRDTLVPALEQLRQAGAIRFLGVTEFFGSDPSHAMLQQAVQDDCWDVIMVGFNLLNPSARKTILPVTRAKGIGTLDMFAVRSALSQPNALQKLIAGLVKERRLPARELDRRAPLDWLLEATPGAAATLVEAAYRFCRHEPGIDVILSGTSNPDHLVDNVAALAGGRLPEAHLARLAELFGEIDHVSGN